MKTDIIVVDNFYDNPDSIRQAAMNEFEFSESPNYKGFRAARSFRNDEGHEKLKALLGFEPKYVGASWEFHYTLAGTPEVYHTDGSISKWGAIWYGVPNAPFESGTAFYKSKINGFRDMEKDEALFPDAHNVPQPYCFIDPTRWHIIDTVGNIYNRLVLFRGSLVHSMQKPFGYSKESGRLTQLWFISE